ncbi:MAG: GNAT family N-acetyltransferase [Pseudomonas sp.]
MSWQVRQAVLSDISCLVRIDPIAEKDSRRRAHIERAVESRECWVACKASDLGVVIGYGCLDQSFFGEWFIPLVIVSSDARRSGVGGKIMAHLEQRCSAEKIFTSTNASNMPMRHLLMQRGYQPSGTIENLDPGDPELIFVKLVN